MDSSIETSGPEPGPTTAQSVLRLSQLLYPVILIVTFVVSSAVHTVVTAKSEEELVMPTVRGPDGKPLPATKRRKKKEEEEEQQQGLKEVDEGGRKASLAWSVFLYLTGGIILSFVANGAAVAVHAMQSSREAGLDDAWWCGEERTVSLHLAPSVTPPPLPLPLPLSSDAG
ncbi:hypothetical protein VTJ49DRAFT_1379 [Mycothermus thermophilus]|uniref:Uncharacterized protein n=1 Tax=Humicola insolens TaxID=85995 RepID=A0ABR3VPB4_HUMIN